MITSAQIRNALAELIKEKAGVNLRVHFNHVLQADESYIWVQMRPGKKDFGGDYFQRTVRIDFQVVLKPDNFGEVKHTDLYDIAEKFDEAIHPTVKICDRFITVIDSQTHIFDNILHFEFMLDFTDYIVGNSDDDTAELMEELSVRIV